MLGLEYKEGKDDDQRQMCKKAHHPVMHKGSQMDTMRYNRRRNESAGWPPLKNGERLNFDHVERAYTDSLRSAKGAVNFTEQVEQVSFVRATKL